MLWFQPLPWARWSLIALVVVATAWIEVKPDSKVEVPFAVAPIVPGDVLAEHNVEFRELPEGHFEPAGLGSVAARGVLPGEPILASHVDDSYRVVPVGWWVIPIELPDGANVGDPVRLILLDSGSEVAGVVAHPGSDDPFAAADGGVAVPPEAASEAAIAAANSRLAVLISTG